MCSIETCTPCTTCEIKMCKFNRNPNAILSRAEKAVLISIFNKIGCPFKDKKYSVQK